MIASLAVALATAAAASEHTARIFVTVRVVTSGDVRLDGRHVVTRTHGAPAPITTVDGAALPSTGEVPVRPAGEPSIVTVLY